MKKWYAIAAVVLAAVLQRRQLRLWRQSAAQVAVPFVITKRRPALRCGVARVGPPLTGVYWH